jgi:hypothetical protein
MARLISPAKPRGVAANPVPTAAPAPAAVQAPVLPVSTTTPLPGQPPDALNPAEAAERSLLRRAAGRSGTVLTSLRGVLAPGGLAPQRKRLLGE